MSRDYMQEWEETVSVLTLAVAGNYNIYAVLLQKELKAYIRTGEASTQLLKLIDNNSNIREAYENMKEEL